MSLQLEYARISLEAGAALNTYYATGAHLSVASGERVADVGIGWVGVGGGGWVGGVGVWVGGVGGARRLAERS